MSLAAQPMGYTRLMMAAFQVTPHRQTRTSRNQVRAAYLCLAENSTTRPSQRTCWALPESKGCAVTFTTTQATEALQPQNTGTRTQAVFKDTSDRHVRGSQ